MYAVELDWSKRLLVISAAAKITAEEAKMAAQSRRYKGRTRWVQRLVLWRMRRWFMTN